MLEEGKQQCGVHIQLCSSSEQGEECKCRGIDPIECHVSSPVTCGCHGSPSNGCRCRSHRNCKEEHIIFCRENLKGVIRKSTRPEEIVDINASEIFVYDIDRCKVDWRCCLKGEKEEKRADVIILIPSVKAEDPNIILIEVKKYSRKEWGRSAQLSLSNKTREAESQLECTMQTIERIWKNGEGVGSLKKNIFGVIVIGVKDGDVEEKILDDRRYRNDREFKMTRLMCYTTKFEKYREEGCPCSVGVFKEEAEKLWKKVLRRWKVYKKDVV